MESQKPGQYSQLGREAKKRVTLLPLGKEKKSSVVNHNLIYLDFFFFKR